MMDVLQMPGAPNEQTSAWMPSTVSQRSSLSTDTTADIVEPQVYIASFEPRGRSGRVITGGLCHELRCGR
jgi:hypothetical protein